MAGEWQPRTIGKAFAVNPPRTIKRGQITPFIPMDALPENARSPMRIDEREFAGSGVKFQNGDTLIARITPCLENGKTAFVCGLPEGVVAHGSTEYIVLAGKPDESDNLFAYYLARSPEFRQYAIGHMEGTSGRQRVPSVAVENFTIALPPLSEQRAIAHILGTFDNKIELNRRMNETLEAIARAIFKSWFVDFDPVRAKASGEPPESICRRLRLTPDLLALFPSRLVDSELGEVPEGWVVKAVEDVAKVVKGKSYKSSELSPSKTALVTLKSFNRGGGYRLDGLKEYTGSYKSGQEVIGGDLVVAYTDVTQTADVIGKPALVISDSAYDHLVISLDVAVVRPVRDEYRVYLYGVMSGVEFQQHTRAHATGTTVLHLASNAVPGFKLIFPGEALVDFYATIAAPMFASIDERVAEGRTLASLRDTLLPKLLSGELCVPVNPEQIEEMI